MRHVRQLGTTCAAVVLGLAASSGYAQMALTPVKTDEVKVQYLARVRDSEAEVRSGASTDPKMYPTNRLRFGDTVEVLRDRGDGWLEIKPPAGSFSWVQHRFVQRIGQTANWVVHCPDDTPLPVYIGSSLVNAKPSVIGPKVKRGSQVVAIGKELADDEGMWLPIEPPPGEVRYVLAKSVETPNAGGPVGGSGPPSQPSTFAVPAPPVPAPAAPAPAPAAANVHPDWLQAEQMEREGKLQDAERMYSTLAQKVVKDNHDLAMRCYNRIQFLRQGPSAQAAVNYQPNRPVEARYTGLQNTPQPRIAPVPASAAGLAAAYVPCPVPVAPPQPQVTGYPQGGQQANAPRIEVGWLRGAGRNYLGRPTYALESSERQIKFYVTPQPGVDLEPFKNRYVEIVGPIAYHCEWRALLMTATRVMPVQ